MPTLTVTPNPAPLSALVAVAGAGFATAKTRLLLDGVGASNNIFRPRKDGTFNVGIKVSATAKTQVLVAQQQSGSTWSEKARTSIVVQAVVEPPPVEPPPVEPPPTGAYPPDTKLTNVVPPSIPPVPGYLVPTTDPTWKTQITRISNVSLQRHAYSRVPAWNSDGTKILLSYTYPGRLRDGKTYADLGAINHLSGAIWSNEDPIKIWGVQFNGNILRTMNVSTQVTTDVHTFTGYDRISLGNGEGSISNDEKTIAIQTHTAAGVYGVLVYDIKLDSVVSSLAFGAEEPNTCSTTQSGNYITVSWNNPGNGAQQGTWLYDRNLKLIRQLWNNTPHMDPGYDASGNEVMVYNYNKMLMQRLDNGAATELLGPQNTTFGWGHYSTRNILRPGWSYLSCYQFGGGIPTLGQDQIIAVKLDGSGTIEVFGFSNHRTTTYESQPQAVPNRDGTKVMFASEWGVPGTVYAYVAQVKP